MPHIGNELISSKANQLDCVYRELQNIKKHLKNRQDIQFTTSWLASCRQWACCYPQKNPLRAYTQAITLIHYLRSRLKKHMLVNIPENQKRIKSLFYQLYLKVNSLVFMALVDPNPDSLITKHDNTDALSTEHIRKFQAYMHPRNQALVTLVSQIDHRSKRLKRASSRKSYILKAIKAYSDMDDGYFDIDAELIRIKKIAIFKIQFIAKQTNPSRYDDIEASVVPPPRPPSLQQIEADKRYHHSNAIIRPTPFTITLRYQRKNNTRGITEVVISKEGHIHRIAPLLRSAFLIEFQEDTNQAETWFRVSKLISRLERLAIQADSIDFPKAKAYDLHSLNNAFFKGIPNNFPNIRKAYENIKDSQTVISKSRP